MIQITTEMAEHICDKLCRFPREMKQEELDEHCCECEMGRFISEIMSAYNHLNAFEESQCCKLLHKICELRKQLPAFQVGDIAYIINRHKNVLHKSRVYKVKSEITDTGTYIAYTSEVLEFCNDDIGVIAFLTEEDAKQALREKT